jgi:hypothetical protein
MPLRKDLGSILVDEDVLEAKDLERVVGAGRRPLWSALLDAELATAEQIFRALSTRFGVPLVSDEKMAEVKLPEALKAAINRAEAIAAGLLPIDLSADGQRATVVMVDPSDDKTLAEFLTRAQVPEGRALLARREALVRAIDRIFGEPTAIVTPLPPQRRRPSKSQPMSTLAPPGDDDVTGTVKLDPQLQAEIQRLPPRMSQADPLTPLPAKRPKRPTPPSTPPPATNVTTDPEVRLTESPSEALRSEERLTRALIEAIEALASELEARIIGGAGGGSEMARLARRVARQLGLSRRACDEIGVAAQLFALDRAMRAVEGGGTPDVFGDLGWVASGEGGLMPILRALTSASSGFGRATAGQSSIGARIISIVADYQELGAAATATPDLDTVSQLLRASPAGAQVVDALLRVLESDRGDQTPPTPTTLPATSMLKPAREEDDEPPTPPPTATPSGDHDKTQRKPYPRKEGSKGE